MPTRLVGAGVPALDPAESAHGIVRTLSQEDFGARAVKVSANGSSPAEPAACRVTEAAPQTVGDSFDRREATCASSTWS